METNWRDQITSTPDVLRGKPRIKGTRIPVSLILGYLAAGSTFDDIISEFPDLTKEQIGACLKIPASEAWLFQNKEALEDVKKGLKDASEGKISKIKNR